MFISRVRLVGLLLMSFLLGAAATAVYDGFASDSGARKRNGHSQSSLMAELSRELDLTADQKGHLERILEEGKQRMVELSRSTRSKYQDFRLDTRVRIRGILSSEQAERFDRIMQQRDDRKRKKSSR